MRCGHVFVAEDRASTRAKGRASAARRLYPSMHLFVESMRGHGASISRAVDLVDIRFTQRWYYRPSMVGLDGNGFTCATGGRQNSPDPRGLLPRGTRIAGKNKPRGRKSAEFLRYLSSRSLKQIKV